jgi:hypothetical protein
MENSVSEGPIVDVIPTPVESPQPPAPTVSAPETAPQAAPPAMPRITFRGNSYDLAAFASLISGGLLLASCLTCNSLFYCLPVVPIALGVIGVAAAHQSGDARRTRLWSWIGIAAGGLILLLILAAVVLYIGFIILMITIGEAD